MTHDVPSEWLRRRLAGGGAALFGAQLFGHLLLGHLLLGCNLVADLDRDYFQIVPSGWDGPVDLQTAENAMAEEGPAGCRHGYDEVMTLHSGLLDESAYPSCECVAPLTACRWTLLVSMPTDDQCVEAPAKTVPLGLDKCILTSTSFQQFFIEPPQLERSSCEPAGGEPKPPRWELTARVCRGTAGSCITRSGEFDCPAGPFNDRRVFYGTVQDTRACDCGHVTGSCNGTVTVFPPVPVPPDLDELCTGEGTELPVGSCSEPVLGEQVMATSDALDLQCSLNGSAAVLGKMKPASPVTVCCQL